MTDTTTTPDVQQAIKEWCDALTRNGRERRRREYPTTDAVIELFFEPDQGGKKYVRIVRCERARATGDLRARSAFAFVRLDDGTIWKADGWKGPAKNFPRGNVCDVNAPLPEYGF